MLPFYEYVKLLGLDGGLIVLGIANEVFAIFKCPLFLVELP
jgi:hypothetical protein